MRKTIGLLLFILTISPVVAQKNPSVNPPLVASAWTFKPEQVTFSREKGIQMMNILPGAGKVVANGIDFATGTIEFDIKPNRLTFYFRYKDAAETECFYLRMGQDGKPAAPDALQYAPIVGGVLMWNMYGYYQTNADYKKEAWNHIKLVISDTQMRVYVNNMTKPTLEVGRLEGNTRTGTIAFEGDMTVSNLVIKPSETAGLSALPGIDPTDYDPRYIRSWAVSTPILTPQKVDFSYDFLPTPETTWQTIQTERRGLINLSRLFGQSSSRRLVWLKVKIKSAKAQKKKVAFGFGDDVWVFLNGEMAYIDQNRYGRPIAKEPDGRCSIENTSFVLPLKEGYNELLIGLANDFYGWGAIARMEDLEGIDVQPDPTFDYRLIKLANNVPDAYIGKYKIPDGRDVEIIKEGNVLKLSGKDFITATLYPEAETKFFTREYDLQLEFKKNETGKISNFIIYNQGKQLMNVKRIE